MPTIQKSYKQFDIWGTKKTNQNKGHDDIWFSQLTTNVLFYE